MKLQTNCKGLNGIIRVPGINRSVIVRLSLEALHGTTKVYDILVVKMSHPLFKYLET